MVKHINLVETILYVSDQDRSCKFYEKIFRKSPDLNVPGMTEFNISENCRLGLMPNDGIAKILGEKIPHPASGSGIPRCELYLHVKDIQLEYVNAVNNGAVIISAIAERPWGDTVCYFSDPDGHIIAFAEASPTRPSPKERAE